LKLLEEDHESRIGNSRQEIKNMKLKAIHRQDEMAKLRSEMTRLVTVLRKHGVSLDQEVMDKLWN
jgi:hypothetical protein